MHAGPTENPDSALRSEAARSSRQRFQSFRRENARGPRGDEEPDAAAPAAGTAPPGARRSRRRYVREYAGWLRPFRRPIIAVLLLANVTSLLSLILPRATMYIIDVVLPRGDYVLLNQLGAGLLAIILIQQTIDFFRHWKLAKLNARVVFRLRQRLYGHLLQLPLHKLSDLKSGGITSRLSGDIDSATGLLQMGLITPVVAGVKIIATIVLLLWISWEMAIAAIVLLPPIILLNLISIRRIRPIYRSMRKDRGEIDGRVVETFGGIRVVRAFGRERTEARRYALAHHTVMRKQLLAQLYEQFVGSGWGLFIPVCGLAIVWLGGALYLYGQQVTIGGIMAFQMYMMMLLMPVSMIVQSYGQTQQALAAMERVFDLLQTAADKPDRPGAIEAPVRSARRHSGAGGSGVESFEFDRVAFEYREKQPVLRDFSLQVPGGATVALVGPSGAGKTTVTNLVARYYDPTGGAIRLNGVDLRDIRLAGYRGLLGMVSQDVFLFDGTIAENIAYGGRDVPMERIVDAARRANVHDFVMSFPDGYETIVGERGVRLSGGQAQRVSIARAILADPQILILDEATSNLDSESEQLIQASLRALLADRTTFVIAHRLSTIVSADIIVVLEGGRISELGRHDELLARDGRYREMVARQQAAMAMRASEDPAADWLA